MRHGALDNVPKDEPFCGVGRQYAEASAANRPDTLGEALALLALALFQAGLVLAHVHLKKCNGERGLRVERGVGRGGTRGEGTHHLVKIEEVVLVDASTNAVVQRLRRLVCGDVGSVVDQGNNIAAQASSANERRTREVLVAAPMQTKEPRYLVVGEIVVGLDDGLDQRVVGVVEPAFPAATAPLPGDVGDDASVPILAVAAFEEAHKLFEVWLAAHIVAAEKEFFVNPGGRPGSEVNGRRSGSDPRGRYVSQTPLTPPPSAYVLQVASRVPRAPSLFFGLVSI